MCGRVHVGEWMWDSGCDVGGLINVWEGMGGCRSRGQIAQGGCRKVDVGVSSAVGASAYRTVHAMSPEKLGNDLVVLTGAPSHFRPNAAIAHL